MKKKSIKAPVEALFVIVKRGLGDKVGDILNSNGIKNSISSMGEGTAQTATMDFFGFGVIEREVVFALIDVDKREKILDDISSSLNFDKPHNGMAVSMPLSSATSFMLDMLGIEY